MNSRLSCDCTTTGQQTSDESADGDVFQQLIELRRRRVIQQFGDDFNAPHTHRFIDVVAVHEHQRAEPTTAELCQQRGLVGKQLLACVWRPCFRRCVRWRRCCHGSSSNSGSSSRCIGRFARRATCWCGERCRGGRWRRCSVDRYR